jgi:hypothetical protein
VSTRSGVSLDVSSHTRRLSAALGWLLLSSAPALAAAVAGGEPGGAQGAPGCILRPSSAVLATDPADDLDDESAAEAVPLASLALPERAGLLSPGSAERPRARSLGSCPCRGPPHPRSGRWSTHRVRTTAAT